MKVLRWPERVLFFHFVRKPEMYWLCFQVKILPMQNYISIGIVITSAIMKQGYSNYLAYMGIDIYIVLYRF